MTRDRELGAVMAITFLLGVLLGGIGALLVCGSMLCVRGAPVGAGLARDTSAPTGWWFP